MNETVIFSSIFYSLKAQLSLTGMSLKDSLTDNVTFSCSVHIFVVVDRFERSLRFCHLEFDKKEAISDGCRSENLGIGRRFWILSDFRQLNFCGPCGTWFILYLTFFFNYQCLNIYFAYDFKQHHLLNIVNVLEFSSEATLLILRSVRL